MTPHTEPRITAFIGDRRIASGDPVGVVRQAKAELDRGVDRHIRLFADRSGRRVDVDFDGTPAQVADRAEWLRASLADEDAASLARSRGRGRPKLGVVAKEVTLLPRHWAWLDSQRGSASATLRRLVDEARKASGDVDRIRHAQDAAYHFMYDSSGDAPGFQEAIRSLYRGDAEGFDAATEDWPSDVRDYARQLAGEALETAR